MGHSHSYYGPVESFERKTAPAEANEDNFIPAATVIDNTARAAETKTAIDALGVKYNELRQILIDAKILEA